MLMLPPLQLSSGTAQSAEISLREVASCSTWKMSSRQRLSLFDFCRDALHVLELFTDFHIQLFSVLGVSSIHQSTITAVTLSTKPVPNEIIETRNLVSHVGQLLVNNRIHCGSNSMFSGIVGKRRKVQASEHRYVSSS